MRNRFGEQLERLHVEMIQMCIRDRPEPYAVKYRKEDRKLRTVLVPNISAPVSTLLTALMDREGIRAVRLPVGGVEQIRVCLLYTSRCV